MKNKKQEDRDNRRVTEEVRDSGGHQNASSNQGGTTDMDADALNAGRTNTSERGSGLTTKRTVAGSDYDGQAA